MQILHPPGWAKPRGYSNGVAAHGQIVFISGQIGWDDQCQFHTDDFVLQARQALLNVVTVLAEAGGKPEHIARLTWYVVSKADYLARSKELGQIYREIMGKHYPSMSAVAVAALMEDRAQIEIEATAVIP